MPLQDQPGPQKVKALDCAAAAAQAGDANAMTKALFAAEAPKGMIRLLQTKYRTLMEVDAEECVAQALAELHMKVAAGERARRPAVLLVKIADRRALSALADRKRVTDVDEDADRILAKVEPGWLRGIDRPGDNALQEEARREAREARKQEAIRVARALLPRMGPSQERVMSYVLDAIEAGKLDITNEEIGEALDMRAGTVATNLSRGFERLERLAVETGILAEDEIRAFREELPEERLGETSEGEE